MASDHPGTSITWAGNVATITNPDGTTRTMTRRDFRTLRQTARQTRPETIPTGSAPAPSADASEPRAGAGDAGEAGASPAFRPGPRITGQATRIGTPQMGRRIVTRASVAEAFPVSDLADILQQLSVAISDADGAGPAGVLSKSEAALIASLMHDWTIDVVIRRFEGDVSKIKIAGALLIVGIGKGRVHLQAIQAGAARRKAGATASPRVVPPISALPDGLPATPAAPNPAPWEAPASPVPPTDAPHAAQPAQAVSESEAASVAAPVASTGGTDETIRPGSTILKRRPLTEDIYGSA